MPSNEIQIPGLGVQPKSAYDLDRWNESRKRRRMLEGVWEKDVKGRIKEYFSSIRELNLGKPSLGLNLFKSVTNQRMILYDNEPTIRAPEGISDGNLALFNEVLTLGHLPQILQRNGLYTLGLREGLMKLVPVPSGIQFQVVPADLVVVEHAPQDPSRIVCVKEAVTMPDGREAWECWSIKGGDPRHWYESASGKDLTSEVYPDGYEWVYFKANGKPFLPYIMYHAQWTNRLWNAYDDAELPNASLDLAVLWTMHGAVIRDASWPQRYMINLRLDGATVTKDPGQRAGYIDTSPSSILVLKQIDPNVSASAGQFEPGGDPKAIGESILTYQQVVLSNLGISPADLQATAQAESGYAIQLKRAAQRREALKYEPNFRGSDIELLEKTACLLNSLLGVGLPETGWGIMYNLPEIGQADLQEELASQKALIEMGLASKVDAFLSINPEWRGKPRASIVEFLRNIARENRELV